jgi:hypothetical protein
MKYGVSRFLNTPPCPIYRYFIAHGISHAIHDISAAADAMHPGQSRRAFSYLPYLQSKESMLQAKAIP